MTFTNQYLNYNEYIELGGTLDELPFNLIEFECRKLIDERTQKRLTAEGTIIPDEVKMCEYKMINAIANYQTSIETAEKGISSENIDGYSVSYNNNTESVIKSKNSELNELISTYLFGVVVNNEHILYIGVD